MKEQAIANTTTTQSKQFAVNSNRIAAHLDQSRLQSQFPVIKKEKGFIGIDEPRLQNIHSPVIPTSKPQLEPDLMGKDFNNMVQDSYLANQLTKGTAVVGGFVKQAEEASGDIFQYISKLLKSLAHKATTNKTATTGIAAAGAVYAGVLSARNFVDGLAKFANPKEDRYISWVVYMLQALLQGGLALGLAAPFLGMKSLFNKTINGQNIVQMKMIVGAVLAPALLGMGMKITQGISIINKLPFIGQPLEHIFQTISHATKEVTTSPEATAVNQLGQGMPAMSGMPG